MSSSKYIAIVTWDYLLPKGGLGRSMQWIASALRSHGFSVTVGAPCTAHADDRMLLPKTLRAPAGHLLFSLLLPFRLFSFLQQSRPVALLFPCGPGGIFLMHRPKNVRVIAVSYHTYAQQAALVPGQWWKRIFVPLERRTLRRADAVLCFCLSTKRTLERTYGIDPQRIRVVHHAIDRDVWSGGVEEKIPGLCVCVARLEARKGVEILLSAWPRVLEAVPSARLVIVGRGQLERRIDQMIMSLGSSVERHAKLSQQELITLVQRSSVALCPSYLEGFGLSAAEAMAAGTAVVASNCDGLRELIIDGLTGLLVPAGDIEALATSIIRFLRDPMLREKIAEEAADEARGLFDPLATESFLAEQVRDILRA